MAYPSVTYTFSNGTTASATEVNQNFSDLVNGISDGTKDININALTAAGTATFNGAVNLGNATGDYVTVTGYLGSALTPKTDNTYDLGTAALAWQDAYFDGKVYTDSIGELTASANVSCSDRFLVDDVTDATGSTDGSLQTDGGLSVAKKAYIAGTLTVNDQASIEIFSNTTAEKCLNFRQSLGASNKYNMSISAYDHSGAGAGAEDGLSINGYDGVSICTGSSTARQQRFKCDINGVHTIGPTSGTTTITHLIYGYNGIATFENRGSTATGAISVGGTASKFDIGSSGSKPYFSGIYANTVGLSANVYIDAADNIYRATSALKYKDDVQPCGYGLETIKKLQPISYISKGDDNSRRYIGFIADWEEKIVPELIAYDCKTGEVENFEYARLTAILTKAVQELSEKLDHANARIAALEAK